MFESVPTSPPDPILGLVEAFQKDERDGKINLTTGVFKDDAGNTPVLDCVKAAEKLILDSETSKGYLGIGGHEGFNGNVKQLVFGDDIARDRICTFQTPGGTGALRVAADFLSRNYPKSKILLSSPTWPNHPTIFTAAGVPIESFTYLASDRRHLDFQGMMESLKSLANEGDIICLHACCHNPTGVDLSQAQWEELAEFTSERKLLPLVDFAYHGFGHGLSEDRSALTKLLKRHDELLVCSSYSKNFGLYSERIGALSVVCKDSSVTTAVNSAVKQCIRSNYSNPPRHGAAIVTTILDSVELTNQWHTELKAMRDRIHTTRDEFVSSLKAKNCPTDFSFLLKQNGMFSFSGLTPMEVDRLRSDFGVYIVGSGRINVAGITSSNIDPLATAVTQVLSA